MTKLKTVTQDLLLFGSSLKAAESATSGAYCYAVRATIKASPTGCPVEAEAAWDGFFDSIKNDAEVAEAVGATPSKRRGKYLVPKSFVNAKCALLKALAYDIALGTGETDKEGEPIPRPFKAVETDASKALKAAKDAEKLAELAADPAELIRENIRETMRFIARELPEIGEGPMLTTLESAISKAAKPVIKAATARDKAQAEAAARVKAEAERIKAERKAAREAAKAERERVKAERAAAQVARLEKLAAATAAKAEKAKAKLAAAA